MYKEERPWGSFENLLDSELCKVKRIIIKPGQRPSYQYHYKRSEHWVIVSGKAKVTLDDSDEVYHTGEHVFIPKEAKHRIENIGDDDLVLDVVLNGGAGVISVIGQALVNDFSKMISKLSFDISQIKSSM